MTVPKPRPPAPVLIEVHLVKIEPIGRGYRLTYQRQLDNPRSTEVGIIPRDGERLQSILGGLPYGDRIKILVDDIGAISGLWIGGKKVYPFRARRRAQSSPKS